MNQKKVFFRTLPTPGLTPVFVVFDFQNQEKMNDKNNGILSTQRACVKAVKTGTSHFPSKGFTILQCFFFLVAAFSISDFPL